MRNENEIEDGLLIVTLLRTALLSLPLKVTGAIPKRAKQASKFTFQVSKGLQKEKKQYTRTFIIFLTSLSVSKHCILG